MDAYGRVFDSSFTDLHVTERTAPGRGVFGGLVMNPAERHCVLAGQPAIWRPLASRLPPVFSAFGDAAQVGARVDGGALAAPMTPSAQTAASDVYLAPHADDVCFSLGLLASTRRGGTLLTVFTTSHFYMQPRRLSTDLNELIAQVTEIRRVEDQRFADACGLRLEHLGFLDAPLRGRRVTDHSMVQTDAVSIERRLLEAIEHAKAGSSRRLRPWLFCPMGIGGHIDHLAVCKVILDNLGLLRKTYHVAFYEDLPYASESWKWCEGVRRFISTWRHGRRPKRCVLQFSGATQKKLTLVRAYASQFRRLPSTLARFEPAQVSSSLRCECVWVA